MGDTEVQQSCYASAGEGETKERPVRLFGRRLLHSHPPVATGPCMSLRIRECDFNALASDDGDHHDDGDAYDWAPIAAVTNTPYTRLYRSFGVVGPEPYFTTNGRGSVQP